MRTFARPFGRRGRPTLQPRWSSVITSYSIHYTKLYDAQVTFQYDSLGAIVLENYFDENGEATANAEGVYGYLYTYETKKQLTKQCIDANNKPMSNTMGISSLKNSS